jgi:hypothetical protein
MAKKVTDPVEGFTKVSDGLPDVTPHGPVASSSKILALSLSDGTVVYGQYQRWDRDMNAPHIQAKEGEGFFHTTNNELIKSVDSWKVL